MLTGLVRRPDAAGTPAPEQVHLQFGADASRQVAVSWTVAATVARPRLRFGLARGGPDTQVDADERSYTEALTGQPVWTYHARMRGKYERAARYPWLTVEPDPPPP